jgi:RNA polymerase sigma-70 factor (ECF subfamily)
MMENPLNPDIFRERLRDLYARHHGFVRRACRRYVQNPEDADDLAQEVLVKAAQGWERFQGGCEPSTWLYRVAANHCADHLRARRRQGNLLRLYADTPDGNDPGPETEELPPGLAGMLETLRAGLGCHDRHIAYLRFEAGMKHGDIARIVGMSRAGVTKRLLRIRKKAAKLWYGDFGRAAARKAQARPAPAAAVGTA